MLRRKSKLLQEFGSRTGVTKRIANADAVHRDGIILRENGTDGFTKSADDVVLLNRHNSAAFLCRSNDKVLIQRFNRRHVDHACMNALRREQSARLNCLRNKNARRNDRSILKHLALANGNS